MMASLNGHLEVVRTLLEGTADIKAKNNVRNLMMMIIIIIILFSILMMMLLLMIVIDVFMLIIDIYDDSK